MKHMHTDRDNLIDELAAARVQSHVSLDTIARRVGVCRQTIGRFEQKEHLIGERRLPDVLKAYAAVCGLDTDLLLLKWGFSPPDVIKKLQSKPHLLTVIRSA